MKMSKRAQKRDRRGMTIVIILGLISVTLALSYALLRSQATSIQIQSNLDRRENAHQAAKTGFSLALKKIHSSSWGGIDSLFKGDLSDTDSFQVSFATGDPTLPSTDADYWKYPYRITITATGYSADPSSLSSMTEHTIEGVVELIPKAFSTNSDEWKAAQKYSLNQWDNDEDAKIELPLRVEGDIRLQGELEFAEDYLTDQQHTFNGRIDEVACFSKALSAAEIAGIYNAALSQSSPYSSMADGYSSNTPQHWWRFNEAAGASDALDTMSTQDGIYQFNAQSGQTGFRGSAVQLDGQYGHVNVGNVNISGSAMTLLAWINADQISGGRIISKATGTDSNEYYWMVKAKKKSSSQLTLQFRLRAGGVIANLYADSDAASFSDNEWVFIAAVYDGSRMYLYKNGVEVANRYRSGAIATHTEVPVWIGDNPPGSGRGRYISDLVGMHDSGKGDYRPWTGTIYAPYSKWSEDTLALVRDKLATPLVDIESEDTPPADHPGEIDSYQLYPGGKTYNATTQSYYIKSATIEPDIKNNPLGILFHNGNLYLSGRNKIRGCLINEGDAGSDIVFFGKGNELLPVNLLPLDGDLSTYRLPTVIASNNLNIRKGQGGKIEGMAIIFNDFISEDTANGVPFSLEGCLLCKGLHIQGFSYYDMSHSAWLNILKTFVKQFNSNSADKYEYYPEWLAKSTAWLTYNKMIPLEPSVSILPDPDVEYIYPNFDAPLYVPGEGAEGLQWELIDWKDGGYDDD